MSLNNKFINVKSEILNLLNRAYGDPAMKKYQYLSDTSASMKWTTSYLDKTKLKH